MKMIHSKKVTIIIIMMTMMNKYYYHHYGIMTTNAFRVSSSSSLSSLSSSSSSSSSPSFSSFSLLPGGLAKTTRHWMSSSSSSSSSAASAAIDTTTEEKKKSTTTTTTYTKKDDEEKKSSSVPIINHEAYDKLNMDDIVSLCKRRGIIFPSSEIYNGFAGFYDYGPLGCEIKKNVKDLWWKTFVMSREDVVGLDSSIIHNPTTWKSSGHLDGFSDPMVDCKESKLRYRADQLYYSPIILKQTKEFIGMICIHEDTDDNMMKSAKKLSKKLLKNEGKQGQDIEPFIFKDLTQAIEKDFDYIPSPASGKPTLTKPRDFNLMFQTNVGAMSDATSTAYLRPETAQGIFINFKNTLGTSRQKIPFGIAQIGKAFRNEITPRNFIFRSREFEQMEVEYFIKPGDEEVWKPHHEEWKKDSKDFLLSLGLREDLLGWDIHEGDDLAHYARACTDITFRFPFGTQELMGIAARGNYDLIQHSDGSGKTLDYYDDITKEKYIPHVIEPSLGVDRLILALICSAYAEDVINNEVRNYLKFHPSVAPIKASILPLVKNKPALVEKSREIFDLLKKRWNVVYDATGAIGRRYRRADEIGTPFCITVDFDTVEGEEETVTVRDRDSTEQVRMSVDELIIFMSKQIDGY